MKLIIGLGNPGREYQGTRHNAGSMAAQDLASTFKGTFKMGKQSQVAEFKIQRHGVAVAVPDCFMNLSGGVVKPLIRRYKVPLTSVMILVDDFQLPIGTLRMRPLGSSGGHKGLDSIIAALGTSDFPRLRIGTGRRSDDPAPSSDKWSDFVLKRFTLEEKKTLGKVLKNSTEALEAWVGQGIEKAMTLYNGTSV